jgi:hypothetical protein
VAQRAQRAGVQRHQPHPAAFAGIDGEHAPDQVDITAGQGERLGDP